MNFRRGRTGQELTGSDFARLQPDPPDSDCEQSAPVQPVAEAVEARGRVEEAAKAAARSMLFRRRIGLSVSGPVEIGEPLQA